MTNRLKKVLTTPLLAGLLIAGGAIGTYASMASAQSTTDATQSTAKAFMGPHIHGTISSISGSSLVVTDEKGSTYTVDGSSAAVTKFVVGSGPTSGAFSDLKVGDKIGVRGDISGTTVTAKEIMSGMPDRGFKGRGSPHGRGVMGTVTKVEGNTITVTGQNGTSYTVEASGANVEKLVAGAISDITVGDRIGVEGTLNGTTVTANHIMDDLPAGPTQTK